jgi:hypothetical protein
MHLQSCAGHVDTQALFSSATDFNDLKLTVKPSQYRYDSVRPQIYV